MGQQAPGGVMPKQVGSGSGGHFTEGHWWMFLSVISPGNKVTIKNCFETKSFMHYVLSAP